MCIRDSSYMVNSISSLSFQWSLGITIGNRFVLQLVPTRQLGRYWIHANLLSHVFGQNVSFIIGFFFPCSTSQCTVKVYISHCTYLHFSLLFGTECRLFLLLQKRYHGIVSYNPWYSLTWKPYRWPSFQINVSAINLQSTGP